MDGFNSKWIKFWAVVSTIAIAISTIATALGGINFVGIEELKQNSIPVVEEQQIGTRSQVGLPIYMKPGATELVVGNGGAITVQSGGTLNQESGSVSNYECGTTATFTETLTITPTLISTVDHVTAIQVTTPVSTASILTGVVAEYCLYGAP